MEYVSNTKLIRKHYANAKYWFITWTKERTSEFTQKIKESIAAIKELLSTLFSVIGDCAERDECARILKELKAIEAEIA